MAGVYRVTMAILGDEADARDAAQETFITAWRQIRSVRDPVRFDAWLQRVAVNAARMTHRSRRRRGVREIPQSRLGTHGVNAQPGEDAAEDARVLDAALRTLDIDQRSVLVLHHLEGRSLAEIAATLDIPVGTVKSRLHTARKALQGAIDAEAAEQ
jgi:RNA polymerase sigma-70 factor (ECF subfamily)